MEAGIGFTVVPKLKDSGSPEFRGKAALARKRDAGLRRKLVCLTVSDAPLHGLETIWRDGVCVGYVKSTAYGFSVGKQIAYGYVQNGGDKVTNEWLEAAQRWEVGDRGHLLPASLSVKAPYDPTNEKVKGNPFPSP